MHNFLVIAVVIFFAASTPVASGDYVNTASACSLVDRYYAQGCSRLVSDLLGRPWKAVSEASLHWIQS